MVRHLLFDLDGTIADTAPDLAQALNLLREEHDRPALDLARIRPLVSAGAAAMICDAFAISAQAPQFSALRERFLAIYSENICCHTRLFPGMDQVLDYLDTKKIRWGIVTNKPGWLTMPLLDAMALDRRSACVVSGDANPRAMGFFVDREKPFNLESIGKLKDLIAGSTARIAEHITPRAITHFSDHLWLLYISRLLQFGNAP